MYVSVLKREINEKLTMIHVGNTYNKQLPYNK